MKSSALDTIFHAGSNGYIFTAPKNSKLRQCLCFFNSLKIRKSRFKKKRFANTNKKWQTVIKKNASRAQTKNDKPLLNKTLCEHKTSHNSGSWPPLGIKKSSALDRIFHAGSDGNSFKGQKLQHQQVLRLFWLPGNPKIKISPQKALRELKQKMINRC